MNIYTNFKPTFLYIKQHSITNKFYFGKTINNPEKYQGSGKLWKRHIKKHGKEYVVTLWYELFTNLNDIREFALTFSEDMNIVESDQWLNLIPENGTDGGSRGTGINSTMFGKTGSKHRAGTHHTTEALFKMRKKRSKIGKENMQGILKTPTHKTKLHNAALNREKMQCPHCHVIFNICAIKQYHLNNCKLFTGPFDLK